MRYRKEKRTKQNDEPVSVLHVALVAYHLLVREVEGTVAAAGAAGVTRRLSDAAELPAAQTETAPETHWWKINREMMHQAENQPEPSYNNVRTDSARQLKHRAATPKPNPGHCLTQVDPFSVEVVIH